MELPQWHPRGLRRCRASRSDVQAGCRSVMVGVESADPGVLAGVKKGETLEEIQNGIVLLKGAGLEVGGFFIIGLPGDSYRAQLCSVGFALTQYQRPLQHAGPLSWNRGL